jgi:hypothetical protein
MALTIWVLVIFTGEADVAFSAAFSVAILLSLESFIRFYELLLETIKWPCDL